MTADEFVPVGFDPPSSPGTPTPHHRTHDRARGTSTATRVHFLTTYVAGV